jgi:hypothetical protein
METRLKGFRMEMDDKSQTEPSHSLDRFIKVWD